MSHLGFYTTLRERSERREVPNTRFELSVAAATLLDSLFVGPRVRLSIPRWEGEDGKDPVEVYSIRYSTDVPGGPLFFQPYDPLVVRSGKGVLLGIIYGRYFYSRVPRDAGFLIEQFDDILEDPERYFKEIGERWGKCLLCSRRLTAEKSLKRSIGPVCYKRVCTLKEMRGELLEPEIVIPDPDCELGCDINVSDDDRVERVVKEVLSSPLLNPVEAQGMAELNTLLLSFYTIGVDYNPLGELFFDLEPFRIDVYETPIFDGVSLKPTARSMESPLSRLAKNAGAMYNSERDEWVFTTRQYNKVKERLNIAGITRREARREEPTRIEEHREEPTRKEEKPTRKEERRRKEPTRREEPTRKVGPQLVHRDDGIYVFDWPYIRRGEIKAIPGTRWNSREKAWVVPNESANEVERLIATL